MVSEGVWLDQLPYEPPLVACIGCGDPLGPFEVMIAWVDGEARTPLCSRCFQDCGES